MPWLPYCAPTGVLQPSVLDPTLDFSNGCLTGLEYCAHHDSWCLYSSFPFPFLPKVSLQLQLNCCNIHDRPSMVTMQSTSPVVCSSQSDLYLPEYRNPALRRDAELVADDCCFSERNNMQTRVPQQGTLELRPHVYLIADYLRQMRRNSCVQEASNRLMSNRIKYLVVHLTTCICQAEIQLVPIPTTL